MTNRIERRNIAGIVTTRTGITAGAGQFFCETPKSYELWQDTPLLMIKRFPVKSVLWIIEKTGASMQEIES